MRKATLALLAIAGLLAAVIGTALAPQSPTLAALLGYTAAITTIAYRIGMPPVRTLGAVSLLILEAVAVVLRGARHTIDLALWVLTATRSTGIQALKGAAA
ncbi:hypothetical protein ACODT3_10720 [Streptomyces sp. 4.24]|uniref:hypothetical protein n=1 Tax=Streptomyces tritrimontium TaxID=3406573 RepID=UPI003BB4DC9D